MCKRRSFISIEDLDDEEDADNEIDEELSDGSKKHEVQES